MARRSQRLWSHPDQLAPRRRRKYNDLSKSDPPQLVLGEPEVERHHPWANLRPHARYEGSRAGDSGFASACASSLCSTFAKVPSQLEPAGFAAPSIVLAPRLVRHALPCAQHIGGPRSQSTGPNAWRENARGRGRRRRGAKLFSSNHNVDKSVVISKFMGVRGRGNALIS